MRESGDQLIVRSLLCSPYDWDLENGQEDKNQSEFANGIKRTSYRLSIYPRRPPTKAPKTTRDLEGPRNTSLLPIRNAESSYRAKQNLLQHPIASAPLLLLADQQFKTNTVYKSNP